MIKVLKKTFDIVEFIARRGGRPVLPAEIVEEVKLNQATSIRILKDLVMLGYLEQISRQKGYVLGPMSFWIAGGKKYKDALSRKADSFVLACAKMSGQSVLLAVNLGTRRFIISHHNMNPRFNVDVDEPWYEDMYTTATGRMLMAHMPEKELDALVNACGLPSAAEWPGASSAGKLKDQLKSIKDKGIVAFRKETLFIVSYPVFRGKGFVAALGMSVPQADYVAKGSDFYIECLRKTAKDITAELSAITSIG